MAVAEILERPVGGLADTVALGVLTRWIPRDDIDSAIAVTGKKARRRDGK